MSNNKPALRNALVVAVGSIATLSWNPAHAQDQTGLIRLKVETVSQEHVQVAGLQVIHLAPSRRNGRSREDVRLIPDLREPDVYLMAALYCEPGSRFVLQPGSTYVVDPARSSDICAQDGGVLVVQRRAYAHLSAGEPAATPEAWTTIAAIGAEDLPAQAVDLFGRLADLTAQGEYGQLAQATSHLTQQLQAAGFGGPSQNFARVSYEAALQGIQIQAPDLYDEFLGQGQAAFEVQPNNLVKLTPEAVALVGAYQVQTAGFLPGSGTDGALDLDTMRSIADGNNIDFTQYDLDPVTRNALAASPVRPDDLVDIFAIGAPPS